uniref:Serine aminopeptidase S33 domain-containing protein n=1 Tax=Kalanchoe fedtschenkoi TaxID=63787 RepID=A0A7N0V3E1_KALFE
MGRSSLTGQVNQQQQKRVVIKNRRSETLVGILHEAGSKELVIICHGFRSSKVCIPAVSIASALASEGISAFRFDFSGHGESEGSFQFGSHLREADDLRDVVAHFSNSNDRIVAALVGHSKGGNVVIYDASKYKDVPMALNVAGCFDLEGRIDAWFGEGHLRQIRQNGFTNIKDKHGKILYHVTEENLKARMVIMQTSALSMSRDCRVLTVHGSADKVVPVADSLEYSKLISNHELHVIKGANHEFASHQKELATVVVNFIKAGLRRRRVEMEAGSLTLSRI